MTCPVPTPIAHYLDAFYYVLPSRFPDTFQHCTDNGLGHAVAQMVEALCYKPEGSGLESLLGQLIFSIHLIIPAALWP
jgi:hypothetical protein